MATNDETKGSTMKKWVIPLLLLTAIVYIILEFMDTSQKVESIEKARTMQATDFSLPTLNGEERTLSSEKGKVVIINFWASWCNPCKIEAPHLQAFYDKHEGDVEILGVNLTKKDSKADVQQFVDHFGITFPILLDQTGDVSTMYGAFTIPTTIILNRNGEIVHEIAGPLDTDYLEKLIQPIIES